MAEKHIKLVAWPKLVLMIVACLVGAGYGAAKKYIGTGSVELNDVILSLVVFIIGLLMILLLTRYANKPED